MILQTWRIMSCGRKSTIVGSKQTSTRILSLPLPTRGISDTLLCLSESRIRHSEGTVPFSCVQCPSVHREDPLFSQTAYPPLLSSTQLPFQVFGLQFLLKAPSPTSSASYSWPLVFLTDIKTTAVSSFLGLRASSPSS